jgi:hypothetical protein
MADEPIKAQRSETYEETRGTAHSIGEVLIETPNGDRIKAIDAPGYSTLSLTYPEGAGENRIGLLLYDKAREGEETGTGMICQMTGDEARTIAGSLMQLAAALDPRKPH